MATAILGATRDGDDLDPHDLTLLELGMQGHLNERGLDALRDLHRRATTGYVRPWLHGIEHLTINHDGDVLWKGVAVESYEVHYAYSEQGRLPLERLAARCRAFEAEGVQPTAALMLSASGDSTEVERTPEDPSPVPKEARGGARPKPPRHTP